MQLKANSTYMLTEIILIQSDIYGRCDIAMDLAKLKKLKLLWMTEEKIDTYYQMFGPVSGVSELWYFGETENSPTPKFVISDLLF